MSSFQIVTSPMSSQHRQPMSLTISCELHATHITTKSVFVSLFCAEECSFSKITEPYYQPKSQHQRQYLSLYFRWAKPFLYVPPTTEPLF